MLKYTCAVYVTKVGFGNVTILFPWCYYNCKRPLTEDGTVCKQCLFSLEMTGKLQWKKAGRVWDD